MPYNGKQIVTDTYIYLSLFRMNDTHNMYDR